MRHADKSHATRGGAVRTTIAAIAILGTMTTASLLLALPAGPGAPVAQTSEPDTPPAAETLDPAVAYNAWQSDFAERISASIVGVVNSRYVPGSWASLEGTTGFVVGERHVVTSLEGIHSSWDHVNLLLSDRRMERAEIVARDTRNDLALLRAVNGRLGVPALEWAPGDRIASGTTVFAFGNPFSSIANDDQVAVSRGVVNGTFLPTLPSETEDYRGEYRGAILETTAAINDGSWGGPLVDAEGRVVGMVTRLFSPHRWFGGAVPSAQLRRSVPALMRGNAPPTADLGVTLRRYRGHLAIRRLDADGAAAQAGLREDDVLLRIGEIELDTDQRGFERILDELPAGAVVPFQIERDGAPMWITVPLIN